MAPNHGTSNAALVGNLKRNGLCRSNRVFDALRSIDRANYLQNKQNAYIDGPQPIGSGMHISAPHIDAICLDLLADHLQPGMRALDCGSGSGYLTAAMMAMVSDKDAAGAVFGIECLAELLPSSIQNLVKDGKDRWLQSSEFFEMKHGDASRGWGEKGPFNAIHVGAAAPHVPKPLVDQLASPGRMIIPVGPENSTHQLMIVDKDKNGNVTIQAAMTVLYAPFHMQQDVESYK